MQYYFNYYNSLVSSVGGSLLVARTFTKIVKRVERITYSKPFSKRGFRVPSMYFNYFFKIILILVSRCDLEISSII